MDQNNAQLGQEATSDINPNEEHLDGQESAMPMDELLEKDKELLLDEHASLKKVFEPYFAERSKYYFTS